MKAFEKSEAGREFERSKPIVARLDGRGFSKFCKDLQRPFDGRFVEAMDRTTLDLCRQFSPTAAYTQSDEISLVWAPPAEGSEEPLAFSGRVQKFCSLLAAAGTARFCFEAARLMGDKVGADSERLPTLDCRVWQVPDLATAVEAVRWRQMDATRNSVSMLAASVFPEKLLSKVPTFERRRMLAEAGKPWEALDERLRAGAWGFRRKEMRSLSEAELAKIPEGRRPAGPVERSVWRLEFLPSLAALSNAEGVLFRGEAPAAPTEAPARRGPR